MEVAAFGIADYETFENGSMNIMGFRRMLRFPKGLDQLGPIEFSIFLWAVPTEEGDYETDRKVSVSFKDADGDLLFGSDSATLKFVRPDNENCVSSLHLSIRIVGAVFKKPGIHRLEFALEDGEVLAGMDFGVDVEGE